MRSIGVETGAKLLSKSENVKLSFPAKYSADDSSYIKLPANWASHFTEDDVKFVGMQIQPKYVNSIFPRNLNRYINDYKATDLKQKNECNNQF